MVRILLFFYILFFSACIKEDEISNDINGFTIDNKFYPTPFGSYKNTGGYKDFTFDFYDKEIEINASGGYDFLGLENETLNYFAASNITLESEGDFLENFFYDETYSLPLGIDDFIYSADLQFDFYSRVIDPPTYKATGGTFVIKSKSDHYFDIEYEAIFDNGVTVRGFFIGDLQLRN